MNVGRGCDDEIMVQKALEVVEHHGIDTIDTSREYGKSEIILGKAGAARYFLVDTKVPGGLRPGSLGREAMKQNLETSLLELQTDTVIPLCFDPLRNMSVESSIGKRLLFPRSV